MVPQVAPGLRASRHLDQIDAAIRRVVESGRYILGAETEAFEAEFAQYLGVPHVVGVNSGTDALTLALDACDIGRDDEVLVPAMTSPATVLAILRLGARPRFVDVEKETRGIDPHRIAAAKSSRTKAVIVVHLHGVPAQIMLLAAAAKSLGLILIEDCAHAHGARIDGRHVGSYGQIAAFSFYPTKNLGALGDGGCVVTSSLELAQRVRRRRSYGFDDQQICVERGFNSRLSEFQAAVLRVFLPTLDEDNAARIAFARFYDDLFARTISCVPVGTPPRRAGSVYHQYAITITERDRFAQRLAKLGVGTGVHYPLGVHEHPALANGETAEPMLVSEDLARTMLSLPIQPEFRQHEEYIAQTLRTLLTGADVEAT